MQLNVTQNQELCDKNDDIQSLWYVKYLQVSQEDKLDG